MTTPVPDAQAQSPSPLPVPPGAVREPLPSPVLSGVAPSDVSSATSEPRAVSHPDLDKRLTFADQTHQYIREYIRLADQKATFFFTASTALLAFLYKAGVSERWLKPILDWNVLDIATCVAMLALAVSALAAVIVVLPRTAGSRRGYLFWEAIAEYDTTRQYADDLATISLPTLLQVKAEHCHDLARVCRRKYRTLRVAIWSAAIGLLGSILVFLFVH